MQDSFIPEGYQVGTIQELCGSVGHDYDLHGECQMCGTIVEEAGSVEPEYIFMPYIRKTEAIKRIVVDGEYAWLTYYQEVPSVFVLDTSVEFPTEFASGHDWLTVVDDTGKKSSISSRRRIMNDSDDRIRDYDDPMVHPADRFGGQMWQGIVIVDERVYQVCPECHVTIASALRECDTCK